MTVPDEAAALEFHPRRRRRWVVSGLVVLLCGGAVGTYVADPFRTSPKAAAKQPTATGLATVTRRDLTSQTQVDGTLGYDGTYTVLNQLHGTITWLPALGAVIRPGHVLYRVDGTPVFLLRGSVPAYRDLAAGASADDVRGADVRQLNAALVALGYATRDQIDPTSDEFDWQTKAAVKRFQADHGLDETGRLPLGSVVFLPRPLRITTEPMVRGAGAPPGSAVLTGTSTRRVVSIDLDAAQQGQIKRGDAVTVTLPDNTTTPGFVSTVGKVATAASGGGSGSDSSPTIQVTVTLRRPAEAGSLDQAPVLVGIVTASVKDALVVPVTALLALAGGGYGVEVAGRDGTRHLVAVTLGLFDGADGLVQVTGTSLSADQRVVVPSS